MIRIFLFPLLWLTALVLQGQDTIRIPTTNLYTALPAGFTIEGPDAIITGRNFLTSIMEMPGTAFATSVGDPEGLKQQYVAGNIVLESFRTDTLAGTVYHYLSAREPRRVYQIFFGNEAFVAIATIEPVNGAPIDTLAAQQLVQGFTFTPSTADPIEEHARFTLRRENFGYELASHMNTMFGFESRDSQSMLLVMQLPVALSNEALVTQMMAGMNAKGVELTTLDAGEVTIGPFTGYRLLATPTHPEQSEHLKWMALFATSNAETQLLFQLMHRREVADTATEWADLMDHFGWR